MGGAAPVLLCQITPPPAPRGTSRVVNRISGLCARHRQTGLCARHRQTLDQHHVNFQTAYYISPLSFAFLKTHIIIHIKLE